MSNLSFLSKVQKRVFIQSVFLLMIIFLAFTRWMPGGDPLNPESGSRAWIEMALVISALVLLAFVWGPRQVFAGFRSPTFVFLVLFSIWAIMTALWAQNPILAAGKGIELLIITLVSAGIAMKVVKAGISLPAVLFISLLTIIAFLMIISLVSKGSPFIMAQYGVRSRLTLGFTHPNTIATLFATISICSAYLFLFARKSRLSVLHIAIIVIFLVLIFLTDSRTTLVATISTILLLLVYRIQPKPIFYIVVFGVVILLLLILVTLLSGIFDRQIQVFFLEHADFLTLNGRTILWQSAIEKLDGINLLGNGYYNTRFLFLDEYAGGWGYHSHNAFIEVYVATGLIGAFLASSFYVLSIFSLKNFWKFPLPLTYLLYLTVESLMETKMFVPNIPMLVLSLLIFYQQFLISVKKIDDDRNIA